MIFSLQMDFDRRWKACGLPVTSRPSLFRARARLKERLTQDDHSQVRGLTALLPVSLQCLPGALPQEQKQRGN